MQHRPFPWFFAIGVLAAVTRASAQPASEPTAMTCPRGITYVNNRGDKDGCLAAPKGTPNNVTLFQRPDFFTGYAAQSGQRYTTRPPWNVAGVDYPVGIPAGTVLKDPATAKLPEGCVYSAHGMSAPFTGPSVKCANSVNPVFDGFDWSGTIAGAGSHGCVVLLVGAKPGGKVTFTRNYVKPDAGCMGKSNYGIPVHIVVGSADIDFEYNVFDSSPPTTSVAFQPVTFGPGSQIFKYNVFLNIPARPIGGTSDGDMLVAYNYVENFVFAGNQGHGELVVNTSSGTQKHTHYFYNTILEGSLAGAGTGTANIWVANGLPPGATYEDAQVLNNVTVTNLNGGKVTVAHALADLNANHLATQIRDNYTDKTGAYDFGLTQNAMCSKPVAFSGNIDLVSGSGFSGWNTPGSKGC